MAGNASGLEVKKVSTNSIEFLENRAHTEATAGHARSREYGRDDVAAVRRTRR